VLSEGADNVYPLFIAFEETPERIKRGLKGAFLPYIVRSLEDLDDSAEAQIPAESLWTDAQEDTLYPE
jgi:hypothetical protein